MLDWTCLTHAAVAFVGVHRPHIIANIYGRLTLALKDVHNSLSTPQVFAMTLTLNDTLSPQLCNAQGLGNYPSTVSNLLSIFIGVCC